MEITQEQRNKIALEEFNKASLQDLATVVMCRSVRKSIENNIDCVQLKTEATILDVRYEIELEIKFKQVTK